MEQKLYQQTKQTPLSQQAKNEFPTFRTKSAYSFSRQSDKSTFTGLGKQPLRDMPSHDGYLPTGSIPETSQQQENFSRDSGRTLVTLMPAPMAEEANPLARVAGSYADDPFWDEFMQIMQESSHSAKQTARRGQSADVLARALFRRGLDLEDVPDPQQRTNDSAASGQTLADTLQEFIGIVDSRMTEPLDANQVSGKSAAFTDILAEKARRQGLTL